MKTRSLILICALGIIVLFSVLFGIGIIKVSLYKSDMSSNISSTWNNTKSVGILNGSNEKSSFPELSFIVVYKSKIVGDLNAANPIKVDISDKDLGSLWFPLVCESDYKFSIPCKYTQEINTDSVIGKKIIDGEIHVSGKYKFIGLFSKEIVTNLVVDKVMNDIYNDVKKHLDKKSFQNHINH